MSVDQKHPLYSSFLDLWEQMRDTYRGEHVVKEKARKYLPATSGMIADGMTNSNAPGYQAYQAYLTRAHFPDMVKEAVESAIGVMHQKPPIIELPAALEPMRSMATLQGESLDVLLRRINEKQLVSGRVGLLTDFPASTRTDARFVGTDGTSVKTGAPGAPPTVPYIAMYESVSIINWDQGYRDGIAAENLNLVVLEESEFERNDDFTWEWINKYRVLVLGETNVNEPEGVGAYRFGVFRDNEMEFTESRMQPAMFKGRSLEFIPFVFVNTKDVVPEPDDPCLLGLSDLMLTIYRQDADYKQNLFMQGQDTLVTIGGETDDAPKRVGASAVLALPSGADAKYIGVTDAGIREQRESLQNDMSRAQTKGGQILNNQSADAESGEALNIRVAARTASLKQVVLTGAFAMEKSLKQAAIWVGANPDEVVVMPNLDFQGPVMASKTLVEMQTAKNAGAVISNRSIHKKMADQDLTDLTFEEEMEEIDAEEPIGFGAQGMAALEQELALGDAANKDKDDKDDE